MIKHVLLIFGLLMGLHHLHAQTDTTSTNPGPLQMITKTDGGELIGRIISQDAREVLVELVDGRQIYIPQHVISRITPVTDKDFSQSGEFVGEDRFATRYFITTNGLPIRKGEDYIQWNLYGPDFQFGLGDNVGVGFMTSWFGVPLIGTIKKSFVLGEKTQAALGLLAGTGSWAALDAGGLLPFATLSFGDRKSNLALSAGYGVVWADSEGSGRALCSIAGMTKVGRKMSFVLDSFILPGTGDQDGFAFIIPGIRWHTSEGKAFQIGFSGLYFSGEVSPAPFPMVQWYRSM